jgi:hypothetical protein
MNHLPHGFVYRARPAPPARTSRKDVRQVDQERYRGGAVRTLPRPNKRFAEGRVCAEPGCNTNLSIYNKWKYCWQHEPVHSFVPRGKRKSRSEAA